MAHEKCGIEQDERLYRVIPHVCRLCGGRLLQSQPNEGGCITLRCADCGVSARAESGKRDAHRLLCVCGATLPGGMKAVLRCAPNPQPSLAAPEEIVATPQPMS